MESSIYFRQAEIKVDARKHHTLAGQRSLFTIKTPARIINRERAEFRETPFDPPEEEVKKAEVAWIQKALIIKLLNI